MKKIKKVYNYQMGFKIAFLSSGNNF